MFQPSQTLSPFKRRTFINFIYRHYHRLSLMAKLFDSIALEYSVIFRGLRDWCTVKLDLNTSSKRTFWYFVLKALQVATSILASVNRLHLHDGILKRICPEIEFPATAIRNMKDKIEMWNVSSFLSIWIVKLFCDYYYYYYLLLEKIDACCRCFSTNTHTHTQLKNTKKTGTKIQNQSITHTKSILIKTDFHRHKHETMEVSSLRFVFLFEAVIFRVRFCFVGCPDDHLANWSSCAPHSNWKFVFACIPMPKTKQKSPDLD